MCARRRYVWAAALVGVTLACGGCGDDDGSGGGGGGGGTQAVCGNGIVEGTEVCDDGNPKSADGCETDCTYSCDTDVGCNDGDDCNGTESCHTTLHRCQAGTPLPDSATCTTYIPVPDSGDGGTGTSYMEVAGTCIGQHCGKPCTLDGDCDDLNACNGVETCSGIYAACAPGTPPVCNDALDCTSDSCDQAAGCTYVLIDGDMDGYANESLACDARGGDCDDADNTIYPGAADLCDDGKDNDCDGLADGLDPQLPTWYKDCDNDGFAADDTGALTQCAMPATTPQCASWTTRTPVGVVNIDCDDSFNVVYPGAYNAADASGYFDRPFCHGAGVQATGSGPSYSCSLGYQDWDYDCNGSYDYFSSIVNEACGGLFGCYDYGGWTGASAPFCGYSAEWSDCYEYCTGTTFCFLVCDVWSTYTRQQYCR